MSREVFNICHGVVEYGVDGAVKTEKAQIIIITSHLKVAFCIVTHPLRDIVLPVPAHKNNRRKEKSIMSFSDDCKANAAVASGKQVQK